MTDRPRAPDDEDEDAAAFAEAVRGARALPGARLVPPDIGGRRATPRRLHPSPPAATGRSSVALPIEETTQGWTARADGVDRRVLRKLRDGGIAIDAQLDLHGLTRAKALAALERFVAVSRASGRRCLLVIHGRGLHSGGDGPALASAVRQALTEGAQAGVVLACTSAPPAKGGTGATLVYLRQ